jgi:hypothetical protein
MLIVVTRHIIVIINIYLFTIISLVKLENLKYTDEFVLHINEGEQAARTLAERYQLKFERQVKKRFFFLLLFIHLRDLYRLYPMRIILSFVKS